MTNAADPTTGFGNYMRVLLKIIFSSTVAVALPVCILILLVGETSVNFEIGLEIEKIDGLWVLLGLPAIATLFFAVSSPISFVIYRILSRQGPNRVSETP